MSVESDACSLMVSAEGRLMIPASSPGFLIVDFISASLHEAARRRENNLSLLQVILFYYCHQMSDPQRLEIFTKS